MKKLVLLSLAVAIILTACGTASNNDNVGAINVVEETQQNGLKNDKLLETYKQYKEHPIDWEVKFDDSGNLWVKRSVSEFAYGGLYDYQIMYRNGNIDNFVVGWEKSGNGFIYSWAKNGESISEIEFGMISNQFRNMTDHYEEIYN